MNIKVYFNEIHNKYSPFLVNSDSKFDRSMGSSPCPNVVVFVIDVQRPMVYPIIIKYKLVLNLTNYNLSITWKL
jgi:hypothetical protein